jgi:hypothetical protein
MIDLLFVFGQDWAFLHQVKMLSRTLGGALYAYQRY